jgi:hypothetical protein
MFSKEYVGAGRRMGESVWVEALVLVLEGGCQWQCQCEDAGRKRPKLQAASNGRNGGDGLVELVERQEPK